MRLNLRSFNHPVTFTRDDTDPNSIGKLVGYIAVWDSDSVDMPGGYTERIQRGAFAESLASNDIVALVNHVHSAVVGRMSSGTLTLAEDDQGLHFEIEIPDTSDGNNLKVLSERGDLKGCSFGFSDDYEEVWSHDGGRQICTLTKIPCHEVSCGVTFPAYEGTSMFLRHQQFLASSDKERDKEFFDIFRMSLNK